MFRNNKNKNYIFFLNNIVMCEEGWIYNILNYY